MTRVRRSPICKTAGVGMFDEVDWLDGRRVQVKCLGASMQYLTPGDRVNLVPSSRDGSDLPLPHVPDFQIAVNNGTYITVLGGVLCHWDFYRREQLPVFDNRGEPWNGDVKKGAPVLPDSA